MQAWRAQVLTLALHTSNRICLCCHGASLLFRWPALRGRAQWPAQPVTRPRLHPKAAAAPALAIRGSFRHALPLVLSQSYYCALFMRSRAWCTVGRFVGAPLAASNSASRVRTNYRMPLCTVLRGIRIAFASAPPPTLILLCLSKSPSTTQPFHPFRIPLCSAKMRDRILPVAEGKAKQHSIPCARTALPV